MSTKSRALLNIIAEVIVVLLLGVVVIEPSI